MAMSNINLIKSQRRAVGQVPQWLYRLLLWTAVIGLMAGIFLFSAQEGPVSDGMTAAAVMPLAEMLSEMQDGRAESVTMFYIIIGTIVRKIAHLLEYALLGALVHLLLRSYGLRMWWLTMLIGVAYAVSDEVHQAFVPGRLGVPTDVLIDAVGVAAGLLIVRYIDHIRRKKHVHDQ